MKKRGKKKKLIKRNEDTRRDPWDNVKRPDIQIIGVPKEEEIGNLPDKEFRIMIVKMIQNLENKMKSRINSRRQGLRRCKKGLTRT